MSYSCVGFARCYGVNDWNGPNHGAYTEMDVVQLHAGSLIMNNTLWVTTSDLSQWAEGGYKVHSTMLYEFWYWAYSAGDTDYHEYDSGGLHTGTYGDFGHPAAVYVWWEDSSHWNVAIYGNATSWLPNGFPLSMNATVIQIGQEIGGSGVSSDGAANFNYNQYISPSNGSYNYQFQDGQIGEFVTQNTSPPYSDWNTRPSGSTSGGSWWACTC
ncbi:hypothetical protein KSB_46130 [Ktedonobacter robiniae]|uniref:Uncharacterized protein n=2 Tax=Ktedonobacter robiniae TaxID=2778365 RepID=A0ABQ3UTW8_9CHLR|nr:hypothetical protein KSB_46130 [Ktedonobacter robiniae]